MTSDINSEADVPLTTEQKLAVARSALQSVIDSTLHPEIAIRALMVPLAPILEALKKTE